MGIAATAATILLSSLLSVLGAFLVFRPCRTLPETTTAPTSDLAPGIVYLFEGRRLLDATDRAASLLPQGQPGVDDLGRFLAVFGPRFPGLGSTLHDLVPDAPVTLTDAAGDPNGLSLRAELHDGVVRVAMLDPTEADSSEKLERYALQAMEQELGTLRSIAENSPVLTWKEREDGTIIWANSAYLDLVGKEFGPATLTAWPPKALFASAQAGIKDTPAQAGRTHRPSQVPGAPQWFNLSRLPGSDGTLHFAVPIDDLVQAETSLSGFIGTLGKTFAQLPTGLAIFDAGRRLVLFNPALVDLTALDVAALSQQPTLHAFLDALRENQRIPEPRDYKSWRLRIARLEAEAADGRYQEQWTLPTGQTYRVTGQPHPDGAVAFLFEDITSEISIKRRFRSEIETGQAVLDALPQAIAVFSADGALTMVNDAFRDLWDLDPGRGPVRITVDMVISAWRDAGADTDEVGRMRKFVLGSGERGAFSFALPVSSDGAVFDARIKALPRKGTLVELHGTARRHASGAVAVSQVAEAS